MALPQSLLDSTPCFTCLGVSMGDSLYLALWLSISEDAGGGGGDTFYRISSLTDIRISAIGDNRIYQ